MNFAQIFEASSKNKSQFSEGLTQIKCFPKLLCFSLICDVMLALCINVL